MFAEVMCFRLMQCVIALFVLAIQYGIAFSVFVALPLGFVVPLVIVVWCIWNVCFPFSFGCPPFGLCYDLRASAVLLPNDNFNMYDTTVSIVPKKCFVALIGIVALLNLLLSLRLVLSSKKLKLLPPMLRVLALLLR